MLNKDFRESNFNLLLNRLNLNTHSLEQLEKIKLLIYHKIRSRINNFILISKKTKLFNL
jgi:hypothetical protein